MSEPEVDHVEFAGAVFEGEVYLRALDVVESLRKTASFCERMVAKLEAESDEDDEDAYTEALAFEAIRITFEQEADSIDVICLDFLSSDGDD